MDRPQPNWAFRLMALTYRARDARTPRSVFLEEAGIKQGSTVLDFGCGPGSYVVPAARMACDTGTVHALDMHPLALRMATERARKARLTNVDTILSNCDTGLPAESVDVVLLYDIYHDLLDPTAVMRELHRALKPVGILSSHDHHLGETRLKQAIESSGLFRTIREGKRTLTFAPQVRRNETRS